MNVVLNPFSPGAGRIPIINEARLQCVKPDYFVLPRTLYSEFSSELDYIRQWGGKFVTAVPVLRVL
jgi:hypothetical protein